LDGRSKSRCCGQSEWVKSDVIFSASHYSLPLLFKYSLLMVWSEEILQRKERELHRDAQDFPALEKVIPRILELMRLRNKYSPAGSLKNLAEIRALEKEIYRMDSEVREYIEGQKDITWEQKQKLTNWYGIMPAEFRKKWAQGIQEEIGRFRTGVLRLAIQMETAILVLPLSVRKEGEQYRYFWKEATQIREKYEELVDASSLAINSLYSEGEMSPAPDDSLRRTRFEDMEKMRKALDALRESYFKNADYGHSLWSLRLLIFASIISITSVIIATLAYLKEDKVYLNTTSPIQVEVQRRQDP